MDEEPSDFLAQRVNAAAGLIAQLQTLKVADPLRAAGLRILDLVAESITKRQPAEKAALIEIGGGRNKS
jgi:hypothetical protein